MASKMVVVDEKSSTIREVWEGQVVRFWPYRIVSEGSVVVGPAYLVDSDGATEVADGRIKVFDDPPDWCRWREDSGGKHRDDGWSMKPFDHPTFFGPLTAKPFRWQPSSPKQALRQEFMELRRQLKELKAAIRRTRKPAAKQELKLLAEEVLAEIEGVESREKSRRIQARQEWERMKGRPSIRRKKQAKTENAPEGEGDKQQKKGKKKGKGKKKSNGGGEGGKKGNKNKGGKGRRIG